jgi:hypothetical protein
MIPAFSVNGISCLRHTQSMADARTMRVLECSNGYSEPRDRAWFMRRYATRPFSTSHRGLKPTATVVASLRDEVFAQCPRAQSRRDCITQPRVAPQALPWVRVQKTNLQPQRGCIKSFLVASAHRMMQHFQGCCFLAVSTQGSSQARNPGLRDVIPLGFTVPDSCSFVPIRN